MTTVASTSDTRTRISAVILTRNEEHFIARCLGSLVGLVDEIVVIDSESTDRTCEIAEAHGARVVVQPWLGWIQQRAMGIALAAHDWILILEADEMLTPRLAESVRSVLSGPMDASDGYSMDRRDDFLGALLPRMRRRHKRLNFVRIFNRQQSRYNPSLIIHDEVTVPGAVHALTGAMIHWRGFSIIDQVARYAAYAPLEADVMQAQGKRVHVLSLLVRPVLRFGWCYIVCGGFRLGGRGFAHALMVASSEYLRFATVWERQNAPPTRHPPAIVLSTFSMEATSPPTPALDHRHTPLRPPVSQDATPEATATAAVLQ